MSLYRFWIFSGHVVMYFHSTKWKSPRKTFKKMVDKIDLNYIHTKKFSKYLIGDLSRSEINFIFNLKYLNQKQVLRNIINS